MTEDEKRQAGGAVTPLWWAKVAPVFFGIAIGGGSATGAGYYTTGQAAETVVERFDARLDEQDKKLERILGAVEFNQQRWEEQREELRELRRDVNKLKVEVAKLTGS